VWALRRVRVVLQGGGRGRAPASLEELEERSGLEGEARGMRMYSTEEFRQAFPDRRG
jgi:hypothetical protein